jgi:hypothetical protein
MKQLFLLGAAFAGCGCLWAGYQLEFTDNLTSINPSQWTQTGNLSAGANGITGNGTLISTVAAAGASDYDVRATIHTVNQGPCNGAYSLFARIEPPLIVKV